VVFCGTAVAHFFLVVTGRRPWRGRRGSRFGKREMEWSTRPQPRPSLSMLVNSRGWPAVSRAWFSRCFLFQALAPAARATVLSVNHRPRDVDFYALRASSPPVVSPLSVFLCRVRSSRTWLWSRARGAGRRSAGCWGTPTACWPPSTAPSSAGESTLAGRCAVVTGARLSWESCCWLRDTSAWWWWCCCCFSCCCYRSRRYRSRRRRCCWGSSRPLTGVREKPLVGQGLTCGATSRLLWISCLVLFWSWYFLFCCVCLPATIRLSGDVIHPRL